VVLSSISTLLCRCSYISYKTAAMLTMSKIKPAILSQEHVMQAVFTTSEGSMNDYSDVKTITPLTVTYQFIMTVIRRINCSTL